MTKPRILAPDAYLPDWDIEESVAQGRLDFVVRNELDAAAVPEELWREADGVLVWHRMKLRRETIDLLDRCKQIVRVGVGFDNVDVDACRERGIVVCNVPNYGTTDVADHAIALLFNLARGIDVYQTRLRDHPETAFLEWEAPVVRRLRGAVFGGVGMGRIGTAIARRARAADMRVVYYDPHVPEGHDLGLGFERVESLEELLRVSDVVSLHAPLSSQTRNIISHDQIAQMREGSILINVARGGLIDMDALEQGLRSGHIDASGMDVLPSEPPRPEHPLFTAWRKREPWLEGRLMITPHIAFYSAAAYRDMRSLSVAVLLDYLLNGRLRNHVNAV